MTPLAPDVPAQKRQSLLASLLGRIQANDTRGRPKQAIPEPPPAQEKISAFDDRWGAPPKPPVAAAPVAEPPPAQEKISAFDDRWGAPPKPPVAAEPPPAQEKISAFDDRWGAPPKPPVAAAAAPVAAKPVAAPSGDRGKKLSALLDRVLKAGKRAS